MRERFFGNSSLKTSEIGLGALHFGVFFNQQETTRLIHYALEHGINFLDTSPLYGNGLSETFIGKALRGKRKKVVLSTKTGLQVAKTKKGTFGVAAVPLTKKYLRSSLEQSLQALKTDSIDLYQLHAFDSTIAFAESLQTLQDFIKEGKVRFIGCSNYTAEQYQRVQRVAVNKDLSRFVSFQVHYNLLERRAEEKIFPLAEHHKVGLIVNRALARGILGGQYKTDGIIPAQSRAAKSWRVKRWLDRRTLSLVERLNAFAQKKGIDVAKLALSWSLARPEVTVTLVGVREQKQLQQCIEAADGVLTAADLKRIENMIEEEGLTARVMKRPTTFFEK